MEVYGAGTTAEIKALETFFIELDPEAFSAIGATGIKKPQLQSSALMRDFYEHHVTVTPYCLQIWKVVGCTCIACSAGHIKPVRMPVASFQKLHKLPCPRRGEDVDGELHYKSFSEVYGEEPDPVDQPGTGRQQKKAQGNGVNCPL